MAVEQEVEQGSSGGGGGQSSFSSTAFKQLDTKLVPQIAYLRPVCRWAFIAVNVVKFRPQIVTEGEKRSSPWNTFTHKSPFVKFH